MRITIDNEDGLGPLDYTPAVLAEGPITIQRTLNAPSRCTAKVLLGTAGLPAPQRRARVVVSNDSGVFMFTGYLTTEVIAEYVGTGIQGPVYRARLNALSDDWLLNKQGSGASAVTNGLVVGTSVSGLISQMTEIAQTPLNIAGIVSSEITVNPGDNLRALGAFAVDPAVSWSTNAGAAASASYASYRALGNVVYLTSAGSVAHSFSDGDGTLNVAEFTTAHVRELANDVTLSGAEEAAAYVQEVFSGDGTTSVFELSRSIYRGTDRTLLRDNFTGPVLDSSQWTTDDTSNVFALSSAGLTIQGGIGLGSQATLTGLKVVEMGGFLLAELGGVVFGGGSDAVLAGFHTALGPVSNCFAGFRVRQSTSNTGGVTVVVPIVDGGEIGTVFTPTPNHRYTLRLRFYSVEMQRVAQQYRCMIDGQLNEFGSMSAQPSPVQLCFELLDEGASSDTPATVLYDSAKSGSPVLSGPASCVFAAVSATVMYGSIASIQLTRPGSAWVVSTLPNGTSVTRLVGLAGSGLDCTLSYGGEAGSPGKLTFYAGRVPAAGERVVVYYRTQRRAVARIAESASILQEQAASTTAPVAGASRWLGRVDAPLARSSADCEAAAQAILAMATARSAALSGTYTAINPAKDIWPGDLLVITSGEQTTSFLIRSTTAEDSHALPESIRYKISFANDWAGEWADGFGLRLTDSIAKDAWLPPTAASGPAQVCPNLLQLTIASLTSSAIQVDAGNDPPSGGGFEVRRRDWSFGFGVDAADLVLRSPVRSFSLPRAAQVEEYFVRMYDGNQPPRYSRFSTLLCVNWPVS